jgi:prevent-host-death family protein
MPQVNIHEAKTRLSELLERVQQGEAVVIAKAGKPIAQISPLLAKPPIVLGLLEGKLQTPPDFNAPLPEDLLAAFQGER